MDFKPKAGKECEARINTKWLEIKPDYVGNDILVFTNSTRHEIVIRIDENNFRPVQTKEQREIEELEIILCKNWGKSADVIAKQIHNAKFTKQEKE